MIDKEGAKIMHDLSINLIAVIILKSCAGTSSKNVPLGAKHRNVY